MGKSNPAWISAGPEPDEKKEAKPKLFTPCSALDYVEALRAFYAREEKNRANAFLYQKSPQDRLPQLAAKVTVNLPEEVRNAKDQLTADFAAQHISECSVTVQYGNENIQIEYGVYQGKTGFKVSSDQRPAATREALIAQYKNLVGAALVVTKELHKKNAQFKLIITGDAPKHDKLALEELRKAIQEVCAANNIHSANLWGVEWNNPDFKASIDADLDSEIDPGAQPARIGFGASPR